MGAVVLTALAYFRLQLRLDLLAIVQAIAIGVTVPLGAGLAWSSSLAPDDAQRLLLGLAVLALAALVFQRVGLLLAGVRADGRLRLLRTTSLRGSSQWLAALLNSAVLALLPCIGLLLAAHLTRVALPPIGVWSLPYALAVGISFSLAVLMATATKQLLLVGIINDLVLAVSVAFCPVLYSLDATPAWLRSWVGYLPFSLVAEAMQGRGGIAALCLLAAWLCVLAPLSLRSLAVVE